MQCLELDLAEEGNIPNFDSASWGEAFIKLKEYLIIGIWDIEVCEYSLKILDCFLQTEHL